MIRIERSKIKFVGDSETRLEDVDLANALVHNSKEIMSSLQKVVGGLNLQDISIGEKGGIVVNNSAFMAAVKEKMASQKEAGHLVLANLIACADIHCK